MNFLDELPERLRRNVLLIKDKTGSGTNYDDAVELAKYVGLLPNPSREDNRYNRFIKETMGVREEGLSDYVLDVPA